MFERQLKKESERRTLKVGGAPLVHFTFYKRLRKDWRTRKIGGSEFFTF